MQRKRARAARKDFNEDEFFAFAKKYLSEAFLNSQRIDCPPDAGLNPPGRASQGSRSFRQPASYLLLTLL
jgi:hypothetical protein